MKLLCGDVLEMLKTLPDKSVQMCVTSPPYYGLRDYGTAKWEGGSPDCDHKNAKEKSRYDYPMQEGSRHAEIAKTTNGTDGAKWANICPDCGARKIDSQIGLEESPDAYVAKLVDVFREVKRVLRDDGTLFLNLGDSYAANGTKQTGRNDPEKYGTDAGGSPAAGSTPGLKPKDLIGIPWLVAFALRADGWYLRSDIIWAKPNPMPESVKDRPTKSHEYIFLLSKSQHYYYDAEAVKEIAVEGKDLGLLRSIKGINGKDPSSIIGDRNLLDSRSAGTGFRNQRSVWTITTKPFKGAHFAVFPPEIPEKCIKAGSKIGDVVLDPFNGSGTTGVVAKSLGRDYIGIDLNPEYIEMAQKRIDKVVYQPLLTSTNEAL